VKLKETKENVRILKQWEKEYKKGFVSYLILLLLVENPMYGYEIIGRLEELSDNKLSFKESGIYQVLKKQKQKKTIDSYIKKSKVGPRRKYYFITEKGKNLLVFFSKKYVLPIHSVLEDLIRKNLEIN
jgi:PadR family transcriptional regulator PadR